MTAVPDSRLAEAFLNAKHDFLSTLKSPSIIDQVSTSTSIEDINDFLHKLQTDQGNRQDLRNLRKIASYLDRLQQYSSVIEVLISSKPEILALIWGPIKLLMQMTKNVSFSFDAILDTMVKIGDSLPYFEKYTQLFKENQRMADVLVLFYKDILDSYQITLNFFSAKRWIYIFESVWPKHKVKIDIVSTNIDRHRRLLTEEVNLEHIKEAHEARITILNDYQRNIDFQARQDFEAVESYISPKFYDDEFDLLQRDICERTGRWLQTDQAFQKWFDISDSSTRLVWIQGKPGAGKSHVSSMVVENSRQFAGVTLFAFLSYRQRDTSTISIVHSLIFQLLIDEEGGDKSLRQDLRVKLFHTFHSAKRNLKSNTKFARETLSTMLRCAGPTRIIIDGLDEFPKRERTETLQELLGVLQDSTDTKILISSRAENDIATILNKARPGVIRVDEKNLGCIQAYVSKRSRIWLSGSGFDEQACSEIRDLLVPLSAKSKGMFLYARIVMDNIEMCHSLDFIQRELRAPPESLEEAYGRILQRLNTLQPSWKDLCRRVIGWIGCSPVPLKLHELSFALSMTPDCKGKVPRVERSLDIVQICGPIVEISGDYVHFVHFTVKDYLFDPCSGNFVGKPEASLDIAGTCLAYLSLDIFDFDIDPEQISINIRSGAYILHWFACTQWVEIVRVCATLLNHQLASSSLICQLEAFAERRQNTKSEKLFADDSLHYGELDIVKNISPKLHILLSRSLKFQDLDTGDWRLDEDDSWTEQDPLTLSSTSVAIYNQFELLLCSATIHSIGCTCCLLKKHYGANLFRCKYAICQPRQIAFETRPSREKHCKSHGRPYKCPYQFCEFSSIGFLSRIQLNTHTEKCHIDAASKPIQPILNPDEDEIIPLLADFVSLGKSVQIEVLCRQLQMTYRAAPSWLLKEASFSSPLQIVQCLYETCTPVSVNQTNVRKLQIIVVQESMKGQNVEVLSWIFPRLSRVFLEDFSVASAKQIMELGVNSDSDEIFDLWKKYFSRTTLGGIDLVLEGSLIRSVKDPLKQERLAEVWRTQASSGYLRKSDLGPALKEVASTTCSVPLAKALIDSGVDVDWRSKSKNEMARTPLLWAATKRSKEAAELMRFLLVSGADANARIKVSGRGGTGKDSTDEIFRTSAMEKGAQNISKWLDMSWDDLVIMAGEQRAEIVG